MRKKYWKKYLQNEWKKGDNSHMEKIKILLKTILIAVLGVVIFGCVDMLNSSEVTGAKWSTWTNKGKYSTTRDADVALTSSSSSDDAISVAELANELETEPWILNDAVSANFLGSYIESNTDGTNAESRGEIRLGRILYELMYVTLENKLRKLLFLWK